MDPNANLKELRALVAFVLEDPDSEPFQDLTEQAENMAELFQALDEWISAGGFFPAIWLVHQHGKGRERHGP